MANKVGGPQKIMTVKEFYEKGYLQELNRQFLHPLGLAMEVVIDGDDVRLGRIWDDRDSSVGFFFGLLGMEQAGSDDFWQFFEKMQFIQGEANKRAAARRAKLGANVEDVSNNLPKKDKWGLGK